MKKYNSILIIDGLSSKGFSLTKRLIQENMFHTLTLTSNNHIEGAKLIAKLKNEHKNLSNKLFYHELNKEIFSSIHMLSNYIQTTHDVVDVIVNTSDYYDNDILSFKEQEAERTIRTFSNNYFCPLYIFNYFLKNGTINSKIINFSIETTFNKFTNTKINDYLDSASNINELNKFYLTYLNNVIKGTDLPYYGKGTYNSFIPSKMLINSYIRIISNSIQFMQFNSIDVNKENFIDNTFDLITRNVNLEESGRLI